MTSPSLLSASDLRTALDGGDLTLIDVRLEDDFAAGHVPGAVNHCVFEVAFVGRMAEAAPARAGAVCVYGASAESHESRMAVEKLVRAGYENVSEFRGGLAAWRAEGFDIAVTAEGVASEATAATIADGAHAIDLAESRLEWIGRNLINKHWGTLGLKRGQLEFRDGGLSGGEFVIDMNAIACDDLAGSAGHDVLIDHLKNDDFFDVEKYPEARFEIIAAEPIEGTAAGAPNLRITGDLTLKGITAPVTFAAAAGLTEEGKPAAQAAFAIDRTKWNVLYGSGKFFQRLAGHLVNDEIDLQLRIICS